MKLTVIRNSPKQTISTSSDLGQLQMVLELMVCQHPRSWIVRFHIGWGGEPYKSEALSLTYVF